MHASSRVQRSRHMQPGSLQAGLLAASEDGASDAVQKCLDKGVDANCKDSVSGKGAALLSVLGGGRWSTGGCVLGASQGQATVPVSEGMGREDGAAAATCWPSALCQAAS
jgi:hypothetical protein